MLQETVGQSVKSLTDSDSNSASTCLATEDRLVKRRCDSSAPLQKGDNVMVKERRDSYEEFRVSDVADVQDTAMVQAVPRSWPVTFHVCGLLHSNI